MSEKTDYCVVGAGIVGLATARCLQQSDPGARVVVLDKADSVAAHQSGHNSGVIHAGVYYEPGSLKARYCRAGAAATAAYCEAEGIAWRRCGKLIVATDECERPRFEALAERARKNGLTCDRLDADELRAAEPRVRGVAALHVHETGIADYPAMCRRLAAQVEAAGGEVRLGTEVSDVTETAGEVRVETDTGAYSADRFVACAGLQADRLARLAGLDLDVAIVPFRGDYYHMPPERAGFVSTLIYPVPDPALPFLGVHLTLTTDGGITIGPTAMLAFAREAYRKWAWQGADALALARFPGTWRLLARYPRAGMSELLHALSRRAYLREARRYCPELTLADLGRHACGIRAQAVRRDGSMVHDFLLHETARSVHVLNAPSPAATSAFPIAEAVAARVAR